MIMCPRKSWFGRQSLLVSESSVSDSLLSIWSQLAHRRAGFGVLRSLGSRFSVSDSLISIWTHPARRRPGLGLLWFLRSDFSVSDSLISIWVPPSALQASICAILVFSEPFLVVKLSPSARQSGFRRLTDRSLSISVCCQRAQGFQIDTYRVLRSANGLIARFQLLPARFSILTQGSTQNSTSGTLNYRQEQTVQSSNKWTIF